MKKETIEALQWIVEILDRNKIPYWIGGGFAAHAYGSTRPINDIDISLSGKFFPMLVAETKGHITAGPEHYLNGKWDCDTLSLEFKGQEIDITDVDTLKMSDKERTKWMVVKDHYRKYDCVKMHIGDVEVSLLDPRDLISYKKELDGHHQQVDIDAVNRYIDTHGE